ncbi:MULTISPECIES: NYN domain-containing protein [unclassified Adlercreutzia]|uniref:NYN domain-containing protein n=1 Tax=unclassified Adlercreutzia TaxID=2636013 RepID=UPI0013ED0313|nr:MULTISPECIES: NYN domain-containing protein [unclassified Adlercreutzia]
MSNIAYIDGQNLYMATTMGIDPWHMDMRRFRVYLQQKYHVDEAYYFIGAFDDSKIDLYSSLQKAGYIVIWRLHGIKLKSNKKGNVDVDITFQMMRDLYERGSEYDKVLLVSGDGDYYRVVEYFDEKDKLEKVLLPNRQFASSLYKRLTRSKWAYVDTPDMRERLKNR